MIERFDRIMESLADIRETQARHDENLKEHMRRTAASEDRIEQVENFLNTEIRPHLSFVSISIKLFVGLVGVIGAVKVCVELFQLFK